MCRSLRLVVTAPPPFCLNDPSKNDTDAVYWRSLLARSAFCVSRANGTLLSRLDFAERSILYIRTDESHGHHISEAASGKERQDEMESQSMDSSRATGATKRPGFCAGEV